MSDNEQNNETRETIDDIVFELREHDHEMIPPYLCFDEEGGVMIGALADRIEAAWARESKAIATEHAVLPAVCITKPHGNEAAMRDALLNIQEYAAAMDVDDGNVLAILDACRDALAAPPRNCDMYDNWYDAHQAWERLQKDELDYFVDENGVRECEQAWLFAPAEREGNGDGCD